MTTLEKILQEIEKIEKISFSSYTEPLIALSDVKNMIKRHLSENKCGNCSRRKFYMLGYQDNTKQNDWIPCSERMPKANEKVDVTFREWMQYSKKYRYGTCNAVYFPKYTVKAEDVWTDYECDDCVDYDEKTDTVYAEEGWYETIEHWGDYSHCYINCEVIAWRTLPEPYKPDQESSDAKRHRDTE